MTLTSAALVVIAAAAGVAAGPVAPASGAGAGPAAQTRPAGLAAAPAQAVQPGEPKVERHVAEDDNVRIEELRVRGESQRIVVRFKGSGAKEYEIVPTSGAIDPSQQQRRTAGERVWRVLSF